MKNRITLILFLIIASVAIHQVYSRNDLINGYQIIANREDNVHIIKDGIVSVPSTIVDYYLYERIIAGIRIPTERLECNGGYKIRLKDKNIYFILNTDIGKLYEFESVTDYKSMADEIESGLSDKADFSKVTALRSRYADYYSRIDFSDCITIDNPDNGINFD